MYADTSAKGFGGRAWYPRTVKKGFGGSPVKQGSARKGFGGKALYLEPVAKGFGESAVEQNCPETFVRGRAGEQKTAKMFVRGDVLIRGTAKTFVSEVGVNPKRARRERLGGSRYWSWRRMFFRRRLGKQSCLVPFCLAGAVEPRWWKTLRHRQAVERGRVERLRRRCSGMENWPVLEGFSAAATYSSVKSSNLMPML